MNGLGPTAAPVLCRLCRRPIPRTATKCPYCRARLLWDPPAPRAAPTEAATTFLTRWAARLKLTGLAAAVVVGVVLLVIWAWVLRDVKAPVSGTDAPRTDARPTSSECVSLLEGLLGPSSGSGQRVTPEIREKVRQCFQRR
jgi:hypothetical protein